MNTVKVKQVLSLVVVAAGAVVALADLWDKVGPEVKKVIRPVIDGCKDVADIDLKEIECK